MEEQKAKFEVVVSNLIERDGKFLLVQEKKTAYEEKWNLPGGSLEHGEGILDCAIREGKEETGLTLKPTHLIRIDVVNFVDSKFDLLSIVVKSEIIEGEPIATNDVKAVEWFTLDKIKEMNQQRKLKTPHVIKFIEANNSGKTIPLSAIDIEHHTL